MKSFQLRGTNGSGKTTVARALLEISNSKPHILFKNKIRSYQGVLFGQPFVILGSYETTCGGCDTIPSVKEVANLYDEYMERYRYFKGILFFEGLLISHMLGTVGEAQKRNGLDRAVLGFLDTPLEVCIERVVLRRADRGIYGDFDPRNVVADHPRVVKSKENAIKQGYRVVDVNHKNALENVLCHLKNLWSTGSASEST